MTGRSRGEKRLLAAVFAISLALTTLTVWAVYVQGRALHARDLADLRARAHSAAERQKAALLAEVERALDAAEQAWTAGPDALDVWAADQRNWFFTLVGGDGGWIVFPRTPLEQPLPGPEAADPNAEGFTSMLAYFRQLAASPDPLTRAGGLIAAATYEQQLGHPVAAARAFAEAASLLRSTPGLVRFAFRAELARIDSLVAAGDTERALDAWRALLRGALADHPARLGGAEYARLAQQAQALPLRGDDARRLLNELEARAALRDARARTIRAVLRPPTSQDAAPADPPRFAGFPSGAGETLIAALRPKTGFSGALVSTQAELLRRYWPPDPDGAWEVALALPADADWALAEPGPAFGSAVLVPSAPVAARLQRAQAWRFGVLVATAAGSLGAWTLVLWMMIRVLARQRELARLQSRFVADVSHELKTPLALIRLLAETLVAGRVRDPDKARAYHETITRESERLAALLDNILDLGRIESGRKQYEFAPCDLAQVARQAWALFEPQFQQDGFDAKLDLDASLPLVRGDAQALQQVLVNLLQNAHRYGGAGKYVRLAVVRQGYTVVLSVTDHGIGMNRQQLARLGESFFRGDESTVRQTRGAGLGLAIVNHIVTAHGGKLEVHSQPGLGSRFTVWIPCQEQSDEADARTPGP